MVKEIGNLISTIMDAYNACKDSCTYEGIGGSIKEEHVDIPLCDDYPNLKGLTCAEITRAIKRINEEAGSRIAENTGLISDYIKHIKVYSDDEEYEALRKIGDKIRETLGSDIMYSNKTVYITTPRGGHEILSKFAYANKIHKSQIPSDILHVSELQKTYPQAHYVRKEVKGMSDEDVIGSDWLGNLSDKIENVFIVDDVIASGDQVNTVISNIKKKIPNARIYIVTLCDRGEKYRSQTGDMYQILADGRFTDTRTVGIGGFLEKSRLKELKENGYVDGIWATCVFAHACPDGRSDELSTYLYGGDRCPPGRMRKKKAAGKKEPKPGGITWTWK